MCRARNPAAPHGELAQLGERLLCKQEVTGSNPVFSIGRQSMPTVLREGPYRFYFFSHEGREPAHVHVYRDERVAKIWLAHVAMAANYGFPAHELNEILRIVKEHRESLIEAWHGHFGTSSR